MKPPILEISDLKVYFRSQQGWLKAVDGINLHMGPGEIVGLVGESGSGKSVTSLSIMGLLPTPPAKVTGSIQFHGTDLLSLSDRKMRSIRGNEMAMIFQEPMTSLNPLLTIGKQLTEVVTLHQRCDKKEAQEKALKMLKKVGIHREGILKEYPHQLSGGMRQRVMIAMAMILSPKLLIADEPTTALDVTIQAQILELMQSLKQDAGTSILMITHDLGIVAEMCDRVVVMYAGQIVEEANCDQLFHDPKHPYTAGLLKSLPSLESKRKRLYSIPGQVPDLHQMPKGCLFAPRCDQRKEICHQQKPDLYSLPENRSARCLIYDQVWRES